MKNIKKFFSIGFNKTATTTLNHIFLNNGFKSIHDPNWYYSKDLEFYKNYDCFTDGFERLTPILKFPDLHFLERHFACKFILLTRGLRSWLISRIKHLKIEHIYTNGITNYTNNRYDDTTLLTWVHDRNYWYSYVNNYFRNKSNIQIFNIDNHDWINKVCKFFKFKNPEIEHRNKTEKNTSEDLEKIVDLFLENYIQKKDFNSTGIISFKNSMFNLT